jgi:MFS family permease
MDFYSRYFAKQAIEAGPGFNRWLVPPAALAIHLCIGQAYAFSVFRLPMTKLLGVTESVPGDWKMEQTFWPFTLAIVFLGLSAAVFGRWAERVGPRVSGIASTVLWSSGFLLGALGVHMHQLWLVCVGYGVVGGCGLGIGYITPVSTLIKWFPDRRGLATGLAIMGFGGGAMVASPLSERLMSWLSGPDSAGVAETFVVLGMLYLPCMLAGAFAFRLPPGQAARDAAAAQAGSSTTGGSMQASEAMATRSFWCLWLVLFCNVTAGIGILDVASPMIQKMFPDKIDPALAAGFVGLLSLFNLVGRLGWSSLSDKLGRKPSYMLYLGLGICLYLVAPWIARANLLGVFVLVMAVIMSLYGGVFSTIPAYLSDVFGTGFVSSIHGRLLTAWSCAGIAGPAIVNFVYAGQTSAGVAEARSYDWALWMVAGLVVVGFIANLMVKRMVDSSPPVAVATSLSHAHFHGGDGGHSRVWVVMAWLLVLGPLGWGVSMTLVKATRLLNLW